MSHLPKLPILRVPHRRACITDLNTGYFLRPINFNVWQWQRNWYFVLPTSFEGLPRQCTIRMPRLSNSGHVRNEKQITGNKYISGLANRKKSLVHIYIHCIWWCIPRLFWTAYTCIILSVCQIQTDTTFSFDFLSTGFNKFSKIDVSYRASTENSLLAWNLNNIFLKMYVLSLAGLKFFYHLLYLCVLNNAWCHDCEK